jgi:hypothetical protein
MRCGQVRAQAAEPGEASRGQGAVGAGPFKPITRYLTAACYCVISSCPSANLQLRALCSASLQGTSPQRVPMTLHCSAVTALCCWLMSWIRMTRRAFGTGGWLHRAGEWGWSEGSHARVECAEQLRLTAEQLRLDT